VLEKVGLREEGVLRDERFVDGEHVDVHRFGLLVDEWG
jgi:RimJ/RimL family protein N-acetyltransferase